MCTSDAAAKEAAVARFLQEHPQAGRAGTGHPALRGCAEVAWSEIPGCPSRIPLVFCGLLDGTAASEAARVLTNVLMDGIFHVSPAMPAALPFLLRLAIDPDVPARSGLVDLVVVAAELSQPVDASDERAALLLGSDSDHPEREQCRAVFAAHVALLRQLVDDEVRDGLLNLADWSGLQQIAGAP